ncbi:NF-kappa-B inhibitor alpha-like [Mercenaria mercenaria]|uniref:NF-kappa-B inhibitor alpha-like n=1 Tax=Mercenaria mercenaria TaxID=6596 RepID=UPI00234EEF1E|nr:NF-kappa-B inhibitor alpha-like [Mercenaria mercenaria]
MADTNANTTEEFQSVETDAAPSVEFVNLSSLDIGSECEVKTESKVGSTKVGSKTVAIQEEDEKAHSNDDISTTSAEKEVNRNLEKGLGSLNLEEQVKPEVDDADDNLKDNLLIQDSDGDTALHLAILLERQCLTLVIIEVSAEYEMPLDIPNHLYQTPLHLAVLTGQQHNVRALLSAGASPFRRDHELRTPMFVACEKNDIQTLELFCKPATWNMTDHEATSKLLVQNINPLNFPDACGERCLHQAARHSNTEMAQILIENGADPNLPDRRTGRTPLHLAAELGHVEMVEYLISVKEIDINQRTYNEETALEIAHMREREEVVALLKPHSFPVMKRKTKNDLSTG